MKRKLLLAVIAVLCIMGCTSHELYHHYEAVKDNKWDREQGLTFSVPHVTSAENYLVSLGLRTTDAYPYKELGIIIDMELPHRKVHYSDTIQCQITDENGKRLGNGLAHYQQEFPVKDIYLHQNDSITITVRHNMRNKQLPGVSSVGIEISPSKH